MSTPSKIGLVIILIAAVVGAGFLGARAAGIRRARIAAIAESAPAGGQMPDLPQRPIPFGEQFPGQPGQLPFGPDRGFGGRDSGPRGFGGPSFQAPPWSGFHGPRGDRNPGFGPRGFWGPSRPGQRGQDQRGGGKQGQDQQGPQGQGQQNQQGGRGGDSAANALGGWVSEYRPEINEAMARVLGVSIADYNKAIAEGQSPWEIAQARKISAEDFQTKRIEAISTVLKKVVSDGKLTQAQADALLDRLKKGGPLVMPGGSPGWDGSPWAFPAAP